MDINPENAESGLKTAVNEILEPEKVPPGSRLAAQLELMPLPLDAVDLPATGKRGGRPKGSKNKNTEAWQEFLLSRYSSPLEGLAQVISMPVADLARLLGCKKIDAFKCQLTAMATLAPYLHQKMPLAIDGGEHGLVSLIINAGAAGAAATAEDNSIIDVLPDVEENQGLSDDDNVESNVSESNAEGQVVENKEENKDSAV
ncbi:MAG: hypothetical protein KAS59_00775 [Alphaproteobacteria bacterium]|nr:hypothetical protein [Alphaproteobacteria bacterium]